MTLSSSDIVFYYTYQATGPSNNTLSLGGTISAYTIPDATPNNIFDDVTGDESAIGDVEYRAIAIKDTNSSYAMLNTKVWIDGYVRAPSGYDVISFALENPGGSPASIQLIANESTAPNPNKFTVATGQTVSWTVEGMPSATLFFGTVQPLGWFGLWLRRSVPPNAAAFSNRSCTIKVQCETTASPIIKVIDKTYVVKWNKDGFDVYSL
ncbi:MAG: hypothetical protein QXK24_00215 [Ignisphaera sp.]